MINRHPQEEPGGRTLQAYHLGSRAEADLATLHFTAGHLCHVWCGAPEAPSSLGHLDKPEQGKTFLFLIWLEALGEKTTGRPELELGSISTPTRWQN